MRVRRCVVDCEKVRVVLEFGECLQSGRVDSPDDVALGRGVELVAHVEHAHHGVVGNILKKIIAVVRS